MPELTTATEGHVRILTLDRPERSNALSRALNDELVDALLEAGEDPEVRVIVVTGAGDRAFCAGLDLKEMGERDTRGQGYVPRSKQARRGVHEVLWETSKPTIAAVNGHAVAGGFELMLACDLRVIAEGAKLGLPEAKRGMGANFGTVILPHLVPPAIAAEILFTAEYFDAKTAERWGIANRVVPAASVMPVAMELARQIAANAPLSVRRMKETMTKSRGLAIAAALRLEVGPDPYRSEDRQEGVRAYLEKREPRWKGR